VWWHAPVIPAALRPEGEGSLEPLGRKPAWATREALLPKQKGRGGRKEKRREFSKQFVVH
jgi:hypothetical protein